MQPQDFRDDTDVYRRDKASSRYVPGRLSTSILPVFDAEAPLNQVGAVLPRTAPSSPFLPRSRSCVDNIFAVFSPSFRKPRPWSSLPLQPRIPDERLEEEVNNRLGQHPEAVVEPMAESPLPMRPEPAYSRTDSKSAADHRRDPNSGRSIGEDTRNMAANLPKTGDREEVEEANAPLPRLDNSSRYPTDASSRSDPSMAKDDYKPQPHERNIKTDGPVSIRDTKEIAIPISRSAPSDSISDARTSRTSHTSETQEIDADDLESIDSPVSAPISPTPAPKEPQRSIRIPKIPSISSGLQAPLNLAELASGLEGMFVDEFGNILDWSGHVLGRVEGDLPSMVGRSVAPTGEILSKEGEVVGYVVENNAVPPQPASPKPLEGFAGGELRVDHLGNIIDRGGQVVGHLNSDKAGEQRDKAEANPPKTAPSACSCGHTKPSSTPSPSEIYLDVKSTNDGIQLIIKIPTIFNRQPVVRIE